MSGQTGVVRWTARRVGARVVALVTAGTFLLACSGDPGSDASPTVSSTTSSATSSSTTTSTSSTTTSTTAPTTTTTTAPAIETGSLQSGSEGLRTRALQERLKALKFDPGPIDGQFGLKTSMA